jgi:predicted RNA-binding Zn ribbon-like protein
MRRFLARTPWNLERLPTLAERAALRRLRGLLRRMVDALRAGEDVEAADLAALNRVLAAAPVVRRLERVKKGWSFGALPASRGIASVQGAVAASFSEMLARGDPTRVKLCANPDCGWVIYDESRNRTRRWCDASECGNLLKVRRFRKRRRRGA